RHNRAHPAEERIRLRLALHAGEITYDDYGVTASSITHAFRLVDADALRTSFARSSAILAIVSSDWFYDEVIRHSERSKVRSYRAIQLANKETTARAWLRLVKATPSDKAK
ncbi:MAG TPA: hypothetical protein VFX16_19435, partial [Pseudonocardiaceae bacterium]|nr:hypothetical protein [Pseudonocardiaceae bacterium]